MSEMKSDQSTSGKPGPEAMYSTETIALKAEVAAGKMVHHTTVSFGEGYRMEIRQGTDSLWLFLKRNGKGGVALRTAYAPGSMLQVEFQPCKEGACEFRVATGIGAFLVTVHIPDQRVPLIHATVTLIPTANLQLPYWPRDLYMINANGDPTAVSGKVEAAQRGYNSGLVYARMTEPAFGSLLYFQNLTMLNEYFLATGTKPDGVVGGDWPELGYRMPVSESCALSAGKPIIISDVFLQFVADEKEDERTTARIFLDLLSGIYRHLERPESQFHPWPRRAEETLRDLEESPKATVKEHGYTYLHPYTDSEYPDSMVQLTVLLPLYEYGRWRGEEIPFAAELRKGVPRFLDIDLKTIRRYLPSVGDEKDDKEVDSWYMYHPLINLGRLAQEEKDEEAKQIFLECLPRAIEVARRFDYHWPVMFKVDTLEVVKENRGEGQPGQSDVGGLYAHVMLQAHTITGEEMYLEEAKAAIQATRDMQFELVYQTNITAYGVTACLELWKRTKEPFYREQAYVFLAGYFHNSILWQSQIGNARHYLHFLGATCLHDGPYMAPYECFESFSAFHKALEIAGDDLPETVRLLMVEAGKYTLGRAWYFYPDALPKDALATEIRNGHIDRLLSFPLEDLYVDGQPAGQVGQEIYGAGAAFALTVRAFHRLKDKPFLLYCEYPLREREETSDRLTIRTWGEDGFYSRARLIPTGARPPLGVQIETEEGETLASQVTNEGHCEFRVPAGQRIVLRWERSAR